MNNTKSFLKTFLHWSGVVSRFLFYVFLSVGAACGIISLLFCIGYIKIAYDFSNEETEYKKPARTFIQYLLGRAYFELSGKSYVDDSNISNHENVMALGRALYKESDSQKSVGA